MARDIPTLNRKIYRNFSQGVIRNVQEGLTPEGSVRLALNMDSDKEIGSLVSRKGITQEGKQVYAGARCYGIGNYVTADGDNKLFASFEKSTDNTIYDLLDSLQEKELDTTAHARFVMFLGGLLRINGEDDPIIYDGFSWKEKTYLLTVADDVADNFTYASHGLAVGDPVRFYQSDVLPGGLTYDKVYFVVNTTVDTFQVSETFGGAALDITSVPGGALYTSKLDKLDIANMPKFNVAIEWKNRIYGAVKNSDTLQYSSIANTTYGYVTWYEDEIDSSTAGYISMEKEDGAGGITAIEKVPGYLIIFKKRAMKRWDGASTYPDVLIAQGVETQECVTTARELCYFINQKGIWVTNGGYPQRISRPVQDIIESISDWDRVCCEGDDEHVFFSIGNIEIDGKTVNNVVLKYNIEDRSWDVRSYYCDVYAMARYVDTYGNNQIVIGNGDGKILKIDTGTDDDGKTIEWSVEPHAHDFGIFGNIKTIKNIVAYMHNVSTGRILARSNSKDAGDYNLFGSIKKSVSEANETIRGNQIGFKFTGTTDTTQAKFLGYEFPDDSIIVAENYDE